MNRIDCNIVDDVLCDVSDQTMMSFVLPSQRRTIFDRSDVDELETRFVV